MRKEFLTFLIFVLAFSVLSFGAEKRFSISFKGGIYTPSSSTYNDEVLPPINNDLTEISAFLSSLGLTSKLDELDEIRGGMIYGGEIEFFFNPMFSIALGAEYWKKTPSGSVEANGVLAGGFSYDIKEKMSVEKSLIPILGTVRVALPYEKFRPYIGGGVGYYMGKMVIKLDYDFRENGISKRKKSEEDEASGKAIIPHIDGGFDFDISENLSLSADLKYPIGKIKTFKIDKSTEDPGSVGKTLKFTDVNGVEKDYVWELSGFNFGLSVKFKF